VYGDISEKGARAGIGFAIASSHTVDWLTVQLQLILPFEPIEPIMSQLEYTLGMGTPSHRLPFFSNKNHHLHWQSRKSISGIRLAKFAYILYFVFRASVDNVLLPIWKNFNLLYHLKPA